VFGFKKASERTLGFVHFHKCLFVEKDGNANVCDCFCLSQCDVRKSSGFQWREDVDNMERERGGKGLECLDVVLDFPRGELS
jgi:hypothetical protein